MPTQCSATGMGFGRAGGRELVAAFDGGRVTSEAGALLLGATDQAIRLVDRFAACFRDGRHPAFVTHQVRSLVGQRIFGLALGYEDLVDHDDLRHDPVLGALLGRFARDEAAPAPLAGKSTLNRLEHAPVDATARYHKIGHEAAAIEAVFIALFLDAFRAKPPRDIILDLDATDDPIHGHQEGRFFHGYYDCYCYLPLYIFCGRHLLAAKLRRSNIDVSAGAVEEVQRIIGQIRARWPRVKIVLRADSGFARETLMFWCEGRAGALCDCASARPSAGARWRKKRATFSAARCSAKRRQQPTSPRLPMSCSVRSTASISICPSAVLPASLRASLGDPPRHERDHGGDEASPRAARHDLAPNAVAPGACDHNDHPGRDRRRLGSASGEPEAVYS